MRSCALTPYSKQRPKTIKEARLEYSRIHQLQNQYFIFNDQDYCHALINYELLVCPHDPVTEMSD